MPEEPINNNPEQPTGVEGTDQFNNFNNESPISEPNPETPTETISEAAPVDTDPLLSENIGEAPSSEPTNDSNLNQPVDGFVANPVISDEVKPTPTPFMAPESLPVQSTGSEPTLPPSPEVPSKNKLLVPILIASIAIVILAVAGYFLAKYLF